MKVLVLGLVLALAGAGVTGAVLTGTLPVLRAEPVGVDEATGWEVLETFTGDAGGLATGTLDLRTFWGNIQLVGWDQSGYEITVLQRVPQGGQAFSDAAIEAVFEESKADGLGLSLQVRQTGTYDLRLNSDDGWDVAVIANVPSALDWTTANVCSGSQGGMGKALRDVFMTVLAPLQQEEPDGQAACIEGQGPVRMNFGSISLDDSSSDEEEVAGIPFLVSNLHGGELLVAAQYASLGLEALQFPTTHVMTQYGEVAASDVQADVLEVFTQYGEVLASDVDAAELSLVTQYGDIGLNGVADGLKAWTQYGSLHLAVLGGGSGDYDVGSQYGDVVLGVLGAPDRGYDAEAGTQYGEAVIILDGVEVSSEEDEGDDGLTAAPTLKAGLPGFPGMPGAPGGPGRDRHGGEGKVAHQSEGFDAAAVQVAIKAWTQYGDVLVTDGEMPEAEDDEDHEA